MKTPTLYRLAANRQYDDIPDRVKQSPDDLYWTDRYGSTALHLLCQAQLVDKRLLKAVECIVKAAPHLVSWANVATWTPLHFAVEQRLLCDRHATSLILLLLDACPSSVNVRTRTGFRTKTAFHIACEANAQYSVLKRMLDIQPSLALEPFSTSVYSYSEDPLQLLWKHQDGITHRKMELLLKAATSEKKPFHLVNAICTVRCPKAYVSRILEEYRDMVCQPDSDGLYPLHYAVHNAQQDNQTYTQFIIESLVQIYPKAARLPDRDGRLPLHALTHMTWHKGGVRELCYSYTDALRRADPETRLYPFQSSAMSADQSRLHLSTTYELLRAAPEMVRLGSRRKPKTSRERKKKSEFGVFLEHTVSGIVER